MCVTFAGFGRLIRVMKPFILLLCSLPLSFSASAYSVSGVAVDSLGTPEAFATYRIFALPDTVKPVAGAVTADDGVVNATLPKSGDYRLDLVGMSTAPLKKFFSVSDAEPDARLDSLVLGGATHELGELTVTAMRPLVTREIDRIGYDVKADADARTSTVSDILRKVPMVTVEPDGTVRVNGSSDFRIYKNGRPNNSFTKNAKDIFKALPASSIKKIEVITDPGAREDAEGVGAILNIVTDNEAVIKGVMGTASINMNSVNPIPWPNLWLQSQVDKVTFSVRAGNYNMSKKQGEGRSESEGSYASSGRTSRDRSESRNKSNGLYGGFEASYEPDTLNLVTVEGNFYRNWMSGESTSMQHIFEADGTLLQQYGQLTSSPHDNYLDPAQGRDHNAFLPRIDHQPAPRIGERVLRHGESAYDVYRHQLGFRP